MYIAHIHTLYRLRTVDLWNTRQLSHQVNVMNPLFYLQTFY